MTWNHDMTAAPRDGTNARIPWVKNPDYDKPGFAVKLFCGDKVLAAVPLHNGGYEIHLITMTETGFDDAAGEMWSDWSWSDVEYYCVALPPLPEVTR